MPRFSFILRIILVIALGIWLWSCSALRYYAQSVTGHLELWAKRRPIRVLTEDPSTPPETKRKLAMILHLRTFAINELGLPGNGSYLSYAEINRKFVVQNVFATPEFSLEPIRWCFWFVGCVSYRGYFSEHDAQHFAAQLSERGYDVYVGNVAAYSTLGWFDDPVLSTMLRWDDTWIAEVIFHELAHQKLYIPGDTAFNEAFATAVAKIGVKRWLLHTDTTDALAAYELREHSKNQFVSLILRTKRQLEALYASSLKPSHMREAKSQILERLKRDYAAMDKRWGNHDLYKSWLEEGLNNAKISSIITYQEQTAAFETLFNLARGDFDEFYRLAREVGQLESHARRACLSGLGNASSGSIAACPKLRSRLLAQDHHEI